MPTVPGHDRDEFPSARNGFYAFESALHVFPGDGRIQGDLAYWNAEVAIHKGPSYLTDFTPAISIIRW